MADMARYAEYKRQFGLWNEKFEIRKMCIYISRKFAE